MRCFLLCFSYKYIYIVHILIATHSNNTHMYRDTQTCYVCVSVFLNKLLSYGGFMLFPYIIIVAALDIYLNEIK